MVGVFLVVHKRVRCNLLDPIQISEKQSYSFSRLPTRSCAASVEAVWYHGSDLDLKCRTIQTQQQLFALIVDHWPAFTLL